MENFTMLIQGFGTALTPMNIGVCMLGAILGLVVGAMPGIGSLAGVALLLPLTYKFNPATAIIMLGALYYSNMYGGSFSAILLNIPGDSPAVTTTLDGYPMATKLKQPGRALGLSTFGSTFGGVFSAICLIIFSPLLASVALKFSKPEYFALAVFGLSIITSVSSGSIVKGLLGGFIGLFIATIGIDNLSGSMRFTFGTTYMLGGISFVPILIGLFAFSQVLQSVEDCYKEKHVKTDVKISRVFPTWDDIKRVFVTVLRSSIIGTFIGCVPGTGGDIASFVSYDQAKRWSKYKDNFGNGEPEGIVAPEAGNNSVSGGAMIPMLTLGIPGDGATAIMLGALMVQGMQPGPLLFKEQASSVYAIFIGLLLANIVMGVMGFSLIRVFVKVVNIPKEILLPVIFTLTFVGAYAYNNSMIDVFVMVACGILGYFMNKTEFSMSAIVIGIILGSLAETNFRGALTMSDGKFSIFFTHPICAVFLALAAISLLSPVIGPVIRKMFGKKLINRSGEEE